MGICKHTVLSCKDIQEGHSHAVETVRVLNSTKELLIPYHNDEAYKIIVNEALNL